MKSSFDVIEDCKGLLTFDFEKTEAENAYNKVLKEASKDIEIKGFPKGKVPKSIIESSLNIKYLQKEAITKLVDQHLDEALKNHKVKTIQDQSVLSFKDSNFNFENLKIEFYVETLPKIDVFDYKNYKMKLPKFKEKDDFIEKELEKIAIRNAVFVDAKPEDKLEKHDQITFDLIGQLEDGSAFNEYDMTDETANLEDNVLPPTCLENVLGMKAGEEKDIKVEFDDNEKYQENLKNKTIIYKFKLKELKKSVKHEINDELAKKEHYENLEILKEQLEKAKERIELEENQARTKTLLLDKLLIESNFHIPQWLMNKKLNAILQNLIKNKKQEENNEEEDDEEEENTNNIEEFDLSKHKLNDEEIKFMTEEAPLLIKYKFLEALLFEEENIVVSQEEINSALAKYYDFINSIYKRLGHKDLDPKQIFTRETVHMIFIILRTKVLLEKLISFVQIEEIETNNNLDKEIKELKEKYNIIHPISDNSPLSNLLKTDNLSLAGEI